MATYTASVYNRTLTIACIIVFLHVCAFSIVLPIIGDLVLHLYNDDSSAAGLFLAAMVALQSLIGFFFNPFFGNASDHYGRRRFLLMAQCGAFTQGALLAFGTSIALFVIVSVIYGTFGVTTTIVHSILVDITPSADEFPKSFGRTGGAFGLGFLIGVGVGALVGYLTDNSLRTPFLIAMIVEGAVTIPFTFFMLPETLTDENRLKHPFTTSEFIKHLSNMRRNLGVLGTTKRLKMLAGVNFFTVAASSVISIFLIYTEERYGWESSENGAYMFTFGIALIIAQVWFVRHMVRWWGEDRTLRICLYVLIVSFVLWGLSWKPWMMYVVLAISVPGLCLSVVLSSEASKEVGPELQGQLQGGLQSLRVISDVFGSICMGLLFSYSVSDSAIVYLPGAPFFLSALFMMVTVVFHDRAMAYASADKHPAGSIATTTDAKIVYDADITPSAATTDTKD